jgi:hypothetical protein
MYYQTCCFHHFLCGVTDTQDHEHDVFRQHGQLYYTYQMHSNMYIDQYSAQSEKF